jgi:amino acid adenylation domain-containing protein
MDKTGKLYQLLEHSAERFPECTAVIDYAGSLTYAELNAAADRIAGELLKLQLGNGQRVALCCPKSNQSLASLFGILKTGAAYVPVDYSAPPERNRFVVKDCSVAAMIISKDLFEFFSDAFSLVSSLGGNLVLVKNNDSNKESSPDDLAYVLYTSGSTGVPKGVMYSHAGALDFVNWCSDTFSPRENDRFSSHAPFHFDLSVFDIFVSIKHGAALVLIKEEVAKQPLLLAQLLAKEKISVWYSTPSALRMLSDFGKLEKHDLSALRMILFAGEVFPVNKFNELRTKIPAAEYYNLYGPTETNVCTWYKVPGKINAPMPVGKVCPHYKAMIRDEELLISGRGVMLDYWNKTAKDPFFYDEQGKKWYRTGDLVELDEDGNYLFKGRRDRMVKRNGYRIELDEIEAALNRHPDIKACAVIHSHAADGVIISAVVIVEQEEKRSLIRMKEYCMKHLPSYMIPNDFIFAETLPYTSSHKIDYQKLKQAL